MSTAKPPPTIEELRSKVRLLIVDDDEKPRLMTRLMLTQCGFRRIEDTDDPVSAARKIERGAIDIVLLDWWMPELNGLELLQTVRSYNPDLPIIMMTSETKRENIIEAIKSGATDYIIKPTRRAEILTKLDVIIEAMSERLRYRR